MSYIIQTTINYALPLMIVALAGVFAERSGIINIALEGIMIFGAFIGVLMVRILMNAGMGPKMGQLVLVLTIIIVVIAGAVFSLLLAFASIHLKADQTIGGTALNLIAPALVLFLIVIICQQNTLEIPTTSSAASMFMLQKEDFGFAKDAELNTIQKILFTKVYPTTYYGFIIYIVLSIVLYKTKFGLRLRSCGENPQASASVGINVYLMRYIGVMISGALGAFGGFIYALSAEGCRTTGSVAGMGFLALAVMIFGNWKPLNIALAALLFGFLKAISVGYANIDFLKNLNISSHLYRLLPYVITIIVLAFTSRSSRAPKAEGQPYDQGKR